MTSSTPDSLAIDLGSGRTIVHSAAQRLWLNEPTVVAHDPEGRVIATGRRALSDGVLSAGTLRRPVRRGLVAEPTDCVRLLKDMLGRHGLDRHGRDGAARVRLAIPVNATAYEATVLSAVVFSATGSAPETVPSMLAGADGVHVSTERPALICDLGVGLFEVGALAGGRLLAHASAPFGGGDYRSDRQGSVNRAMRALEAALRRLPREQRGAFDAQPLHLIGGEARVDGFAETLSSRSGRRVRVHEDAGFAIASGLQSFPRRPTAAA